MRIEEVTIKNFRCIKEEKIKFDKLTVLVGKNGAGKSSFLQAIKYFFDPNSRLVIEDFYNHEVDRNNVEIQVTFCDLSKAETEVFKKYTRGGTLTVNKEYKELGIGKYFGYTLQIAEFKEILDSTKNKTDMKNDFNVLSSTDKFDGLARATSYDNMRYIMEQWIEEHPEQAEVLPVGTEFYGFAGQYRLDNWTKNVFVPAVKEAGEEIDKGSLKSLMDAVVLRKISENEKVREFNESFQSRAEDIFKMKNFPELEGLSSELSKTLTMLSPGSNIDIEWGEIKTPTLSAPSYIAKVIEDGFKGDPAKKGHGLQRALIMTLLQHLKTTQAPKSSSESKGSQEADENSRIDLIFTIEEPELYLHPHRARYLSKVFLELIKEEHTSGKNQIIYSTHSPFFVELDRFENIRLIRKVEAEQTGLPKKSICTSCSYDHVIEKLKKTCKIPKSVKPKASFLYRYRPVINSIVNEGFFANAVLVVEGLTEVGIFQRLAEILDKKWDEKGIVVIPGSGKNNLDRLITIFEGFGIQTYFVFDADADEKDENKKKKIEDKNIRFQKYLGMLDKPEPFPKSIANVRFAVFQIEIENELKTILGKSVFLTIRDEVATSLGIFNKEKLDNLLKNVECAAKFIEEVYRKGLNVPILESIIDNTTKLVE